MMMKRVLTLTSGALAALMAPGSAMASLGPAVDQSFSLAALREAGTTHERVAVPRASRLKGLRLTQYQERFAPLDFDPAHPEASSKDEAPKTPIWPSPLLKKPDPLPAPSPMAAPGPAPGATPAPAPTPYAASPATPYAVNPPAPNYFPGGNTASASNPGYYPRANAAQPRAAYAPPVYAPLPGQPAGAAGAYPYGTGYYPGANGTTGNKTGAANPAYPPGGYMPWGGMPPPPPPPETDWGNNPFGPQVTRPSATGNNWSLGVNTDTRGNTAAARQPAYGYGAWAPRFAPPDPIGRDAKTKKSSPANAYPGGRPPGYGWPGYAPYPGYR